MKTEELKELYVKYGLDKDDVYKHKHYTIITRSGIEKIQANEGISVNYFMEHCSPEYCCVQAEGSKGDVIVSTFGSAKYGDYKTGNSTTWYIAEMAEKRALSRVVLKITGLYQHGVFGEDEAEDFKRTVEVTTTAVSKPQLKVDTEPYKKALKYIADGGKVADIEKKYDLSAVVKKALEKHEAK